MKNLATSIALGAAILLVSCAAGGCATAGLWQRANEGTVVMGESMGITPVKAEAGEQRFIAIEYRYIDELSTLLIPLDGYGAPTPPFRYEGGGSGPQAWKNVTVEQRAEILQSAHLRDGPAVAICKQMYPACLDPDHFRDESPNELVVIGYAIDPDGSWSPRSLAQVKSDPSRCFVLLAPLRRPRVAEARQRATVAAKILTPFAVAWDIVSTPIIIPLYFVIPHHH